MKAPGGPTPAAPEGPGEAAAAEPPPGAGPSGRGVGGGPVRGSPLGRAAVWTCFLAGLALRLTVFTAPHWEGDERLYAALVDQLAAGRGYTLQGHPILAEAWVRPEQYGGPIFYHPPGGPGLFWLMTRLFGPAGLGLTQLASYVLFFWTLLWLAAGVLGSPLSGLQAGLTALLAAFTPIMVHVSVHHWLDGPLLAVSTAAAAAFVAAARADRLRGSWAAGLVLGLAGLIKQSALTAAPGIALVGAAVGTARTRGRPGAHGLALVAAAVALQLPWLAWQWHVVGSPFPTWAGRPSPGLVTDSPFIHLVTVARPPWAYLYLLPRVLWTVGPAVAMVAVSASKGGQVRRLGLALGGWLLAVLAAHVGLGALGFSRLLRYVILVTPATVVLFVLGVGETWSRPDRAPATAGLTRAVLLAAAAAGLVLEVGQGIREGIGPRLALILPLW